MKKVDFLIIGQGIAGTVFSHTVQKMGYTFHVVDQWKSNAASRIAGGLINPITGRKMAKSWMFDDIKAKAFPFYRDLEAFLQTTFFHEIPILRILNNFTEVNDWEAKRLETAYQAYMDAVVDVNNPEIIAPFGAGVIKNGGWVNTPVLLDAYRNYLRKNDFITETSISDDEFQPNQWQNIQFKLVVFCNGFGSSGTTFFPELPLVGAKGEVLEIFSETLQLNEILNKNMLLIPLGNHRYKVGATFEHQQLEDISQKGLEELNAKVEAVSRAKYQVVQHQAGIRPTVRDRRPLLGVSTLMDNCFILNGLGTKGISLAPYFAEHLAKHILHQQTLMPEVNWRRWHKT